MLLQGKFVPVIKRGSGKNLLLLHGYGSKKESFYYQIDFFKNYFCVIAPDFPGFGASGAPDGAWSVGDYAEWLKAFISAAKISGAHVIAHSFGARVAFKLFSADGGLCDKLVITGGAGLVKPRSKEYVKKVKLYRRVKRVFPKLAERKFGSEEYRALTPLMKESYKKIVNEDLSDCARLIENETLLVYGEDDGVTPVGEEGSTFNGLMKNSELCVMKGGHFCFCEHAQEFNNIVYKFLTER